VRVHSHCLTGDVLGSTMCDCREMLEGSLEAIAAENRGVFLYLHHTGRGFRIDSRTQEGAALPQILYHQREQVERDPGVQRVIQHESGIGAQILKDLGLVRIRVLTNLPRKVVALKGYGIEIADQVPLEIGPAKKSHQAL
jgi:3,4-dihydroxy 2-butanone 4-phosphate synthase / GTP cyclohydrolase II